MDEKHSYALEVQRKFMHDRHTRLDARKEKVERGKYSLWDGLVSNLHDARCDMHYVYLADTSPENVEVQHVLDIDPVFRNCTAPEAAVRMGYEPERAVDVVYVGYTVKNWKAPAGR